MNMRRNSRRMICVLITLALIYVTVLMVMPPRSSLMEVERVAVGMSEAEARRVMRHPPGRVGSVSSPSNTVYRAADGTLLELPPGTLLRSLEWNTEDGSCEILFFDGKV